MAWERQPDLDARRQGMGIRAWLGCTGSIGARSGADERGGERSSGNAGAILTVDVNIGIATK
jgi:hypothetical protein